MSVLRLLLLFALSLGSVLPHCAAAMPVAQAAPHHAGMAHDQEQPPKAHVSDACVGCATPIRLSFPERIASIAATPAYLAFHPALTTRVTTLDPPPPRQIA